MLVRKEEEEEDILTEGASENSRWLDLEILLGVKLLSSMMELVRFLFCRSLSPDKESTKDSDFFDTLFLQRLHGQLLQHLGQDQEESMAISS